MKDTEMLAFAQAVYKSVSELVSTKNPDSLRSAVDGYYYKLFRETGAKSFNVTINGEDVGTYSLKFSKEQPQQTRTELEIYDFEELAKWFNDKTDEEIRYYVALNLGDFARYCFNVEGEIPQGCRPKEIITASVPKHCIGGSLKVDSRKVAQAMRGQLGRSVAGLLGGATNDD